jgi:Dolichyl-phosphate-mannose-protein mannosyltransferase
MSKALLALIAVHGVWLGWSATLQSPTLNEPGQLAAGLAIWDLGRFDVYRVNPPLVKFVSAVPVVAVGAQRNWDKLREGAPGSRSEFELGHEFIHANGKGSMRLFVLSRWACIPFSLLGAGLCFMWGKALYGPKAGVLAATLWCLDPTIIAHGQLITPDIPGAALGLAASFTFWLWLSEPSWGRAMRAGAVLGLANLAKMS